MSLFLLAIPAFLMPGWFQMMIVLLIVLVLFGNRLPGVMRSLGSSMNEFKKGISETDPAADDDRVEPKSRQV